MYMSTAGQNRRDYRILVDRHGPLGTVLDKWLHEAKINQRITKKGGNWCPGRVPSAYWEMRTHSGLCRRHHKRNSGHARPVRVRTWLTEASGVQMLPRVSKNHGDPEVASPPAASRPPGDPPFVDGTQSMTLAACSARTISTFGEFGPSASIAVRTGPWGDGRSPLDLMNWSSPEAGQMGSRYGLVLAHSMRL